MNYPPLDQLISRYMFGNHAFSSFFVLLKSTHGLNFTLMSDMQREFELNSRYTFTTEPPPENYVKTYEAFLYNRRSFRQMQAGQLETVSFYLLKSAHKAVKAEIHFVLDGSHAVSGWHSPFGSLCFDPHLRMELLYAFVEKILQFFSQQPILKVTISSYPGAYAWPQSAPLINVLINHGFNMSQAALNYHLPVSQRPFETFLTKMEKRKLVKAREQGWSFQQEGADKLPEIFDFIAHCRRERDYKLYIDLPALERAFETFPMHYQIFALREDKQIVAATVLVRSGKHIWYHFLPATEAAYYKHSPMILLLENIYVFCQQQGMRLLDLGTAEKNKEPQLGTMDFKQRLGAISSIRPVFEKSLIE